MGTREGEEAFFKPDEEGLKQDGGVKSDKNLQPNDDLASERISSPPPEEVELEEVVVVVADAIVQPDILLPTIDDAASVNRGDEDALQETKPEKDEEDEEEECGFCLFMKAGPCGNQFSAWEKCVEGAEASGINIVEKCVSVTHLLKDCMEMHPEYYGPVLQAEKAMEEQAARDEKAMEEQAAAEGANKEEVGLRSTSEAQETTLPV
jgi:ribosomal protein L12E/L44/L45/RPP1/RPP2